MTIIGLHKIARSPFMMMLCPALKRVSNWALLVSRGWRVVTTSLTMVVL